MPQHEVHEPGGAFGGDVPPQQVSRNVVIQMPIVPVMIGKPRGATTLRGQRVQRGGGLADVVGLHHGAQLPSDGPQVGGIVVGGRTTRCHVVPGQQFSHVPGVDQPVIFGGYRVHEVDGEVHRPTLVMLKLVIGHVERVAVSS